MLVVRLRSIGDTVLSTPSLIALRRFLPDARIDILLEDWVAPVLDGFDAVNTVFTVGKTAKSRLAAAWRIRRNKYDIVFNLHGGTTATFFVRTSGAPHRVGFSDYQYSFLYNHLIATAGDFWHEEKNHSAEQQLALLGFVGVPVDDRPKSRLAVTEEARVAVAHVLDKSGISNARFALLHPATAFATKQWPVEKFAEVADFLSSKGLKVIAVSTPQEREVLEKLKSLAGSDVVTLDNLKLPEITALASKAAVFVGNDSGIAHIAAAVKTPSVVVFGSSNRVHWGPWTDAPNEMVFEEFSCQPCHGYFCAEYDEPKCILSVKVENVVAAIEKIMARSASDRRPPSLQ